MFKRLFHFGQKNILSSKSVPSDVKSHHKFCTFFGLKQLTVPTRITLPVPQLLTIFYQAFPKESLIQGS